MRNYAFTEVSDATWEDTGLDGWFTSSYVQTDLQHLYFYLGKIQKHLTEQRRLFLKKVVTVDHHKIELQGRLVGREAKLVCAGIHVYVRHTNKHFYFCNVVDMCMCVSVCVCFCTCALVDMQTCVGIY